MSHKIIFYKNTGKKIIATTEENTYDPDRAIAVLVGRRVGTFEGVDEGIAVGDPSWK